jgi:hypothetical protein
MFMRDGNTLNVFKYPFYEIVHEPLQEFSQIVSKDHFNDLFKNAKTEQITFYRTTIPLIFHGNSS